MSDEANPPVVVAVMGIKGGAGKTTICAAMTSAMIHSGKRVLLVDTDRQRSLAAWAQRAEAHGNGSALLSHVEARDTEALVALLDEAFETESHDFIIIDTAGVAGAWANHVAVQASLIVTPVILTENNVNGAVATYQWYKGLHGRVEEPELLPRHISILTRFDARTRKGEEKLSPIERDLFARIRAELDLFPYAVRERKAYRDMESLGLLGAIARKKRDDPNPLVRGQAAHYEDALHEVAVVFNHMLSHAAAA